MAPRSKATAESAESGSGEGAPRRSTRIAAIPQPAASAAVPKPAPKRAASGSKKRPAEEAESSSNKKTKGDSPVEAAEDAPAVARIEIGDTLPNLTLKNEKGEDVSVAELAADNGVVFFLVPKADTPGCTQQACGFRDIYPDFTSHNFQVYCLSADTPTAQSKWQIKKELPYPLLSDPKRTFITALGAGDGGKTKRSHFIFAKGGKLVDNKIPVKPVDSPRLALEFIKSLEAES